MFFDSDDAGLMRRPRALLRFWVTFEQSVDRRTYLAHGVALAALKFGVDVVLVRLGTGVVWTPLDYLRPVPFMVSTTLSESAPFLAPALAVWTLPFLWIGITMTIRRLLDAGWSAWWALLFFVPLVSYLLIALLALAPSAERIETERRIPRGERLPSALSSMAVGAGLGLAIIWLAVLGLNSYGLGLFMGTPFAIGLVTSFVLCQRYPATTRETLEVVAMTVCLVAGAAFAIGLEGAVCLLMVAPLGLVIAGMGAVVGRRLALTGESSLHGAALIVLLLPGGIAMESDADATVLREVRSVVTIDGSPKQVWDHVIAFSPIPEPTDPLFRLGLAYPKEARIEGGGVGATRYCVFSTGAFVEPITHWEVGRRLAFDVVENPRPLDELSYRPVDPPHLDGYLVARAGEFRLVELEDGRTRLEGSTWYEQRLRPEGYWVLWSDFVIGRIHARVLEHIKAEVEAR